MEEVARATVADARWFPLHFDVQRAAFHFALIPSEVHRRIPFLKDVKVAGSDVRIVPFANVREVPGDSSKLHLILHSGLGGSTLLARALSQPGVSMSLQEPPILTNVISYGLSRSSSESRALLETVTRLLSRPPARGETVICKMNSISNGLAVPMAALHSGSRVLCLDTSLEEMLTSFVSRGTEGRVAARKLLVGIRNARMLPVRLSDGELIEQTDLQLCALAWLSMRKAMLDTASRFGPERVASLTSGQLTEESRGSLEAAGKHFGLDLDIEERLASGVFDRHAKTGEPFNAHRRRERVAEMLRVHRGEIEPIVSWARKVAETAEIAWDLPYPLLARA
jgi:hypothetical protein